MLLTIFNVKQASASHSSGAAADGLIGYFIGNRGGNSEAEIEHKIASVFSDH